MNTQQQQVHSNDLIRGDHTCITWIHNVSSDKYHNCASFCFIYKCNHFNLTQFIRSGFSLNIVFKVQPQHPAPKGEFHNGVKVNFSFNATIYHIFYLLPQQLVTVPTMFFLGNTEDTFAENSSKRLTSFSEVPQTLQHLHSMHCQRYVFTAAIITGVNCRHVGWPAGRRRHGINISYNLTEAQQICQALDLEKPWCLEFSLDVKAGITTEKVWGLYEHVCSYSEVVWLFLVQKHQQSTSNVETGKVHTWASTVWAGYQPFWLASLLVHGGVAQTEITVIVGQRQSVGTLLGSWAGEGVERLFSAHENCPIQPTTRATSSNPLSPSCTQTKLESCSPLVLKYSLQIKCILDFKVQTGLCHVCKQQYQ